jgi:3-phenylpropionate/trans-cinnamate dioxygenase ferredoxin component
MMQRKPSGIKEFVKVTTVDDLPEGDMKGYTVGGEPILLARLQGKYYAINDVCSHFFTLLSSGMLFPEKLEVECPLHESRFSLETGEPHALPADTPVEAYAVRVEGNDIYVGPKETG